jgi:hypothetical protein
MSYHTGNVAATAPASIMAAVQPLIDAHAAWEFVETVVGSVATNVTDVYRCLGAVNSFGTDFYIGICRTASSTLGVIIGETYNAGAKTFSKGAPHVASAGTLAVAADGSYGTARHVANENSLVAPTTGFLRAASFTPTAGAAPTGNWYLSVTNDRVVLASYNVAGVYVGLYDSFHAAALDPFPLVTATLTHGTTFATTTVTANAGTRDPNLSLTPQGAFAAILGGGGWTPFYSPALAGGLASREPISNKWWRSRVPVIQQSVLGGMKGLLKDVVLLSLSSIAEPVGDTVTIDAVAHTCVSPGSIYPEINNAGSATSSNVSSYWVSQAA